MQISFESLEKLANPATKWDDLTFEERSCLLIQAKGTNLNYLEMVEVLERLQYFAQIGNYDIFSNLLSIYLPEQEEKHAQFSGLEFQYDNILITALANNFTDIVDLFEARVNFSEEQLRQAYINGFLYLWPRYACRNIEGTDLYSIFVSGVRKYRLLDSNTQQAVHCFTELTQLAPDVNTPRAFFDEFRELIAQGFKDYPQNCTGLILTLLQTEDRAKFDFVRKVIEELELQKSDEFNAQYQRLEAGIISNLQKINQANGKRRAPGDIVESWGRVFDSYHARFPDVFCVQQYPTASFKLRPYFEYFKLFNLVHTLDRRIFPGLDSMEGNIASQAYKMSVLFQNDFKNGGMSYLRCYIEANGHTNALQGIHDAMNFEIPGIGEQGFADNTDLRWSPQAWSNLILRLGPQVIKYLGIADLIEKAIYSNQIEGVKSLADIRSIEQFLAVVHEAAKDDNYFTMLLISHGIPLRQAHMAEEIWETKRKSKSDLPDVIIDGNDISDPHYDLSDYYMAKVPDDDPRALLLGKLTDCCQYYGGAGSSCVEYGITQENSGFYAIYKKGTQGEYDLYNDSIEGQSWAWISDDKRDLILDSFEPRTRDLGVLCIPFFSAFEQKVKDKFKVKLGNGGQTPDLANIYEISTSPPKLPRNYQGHSDASTQYDLSALKHRKPALAAIG
jgi:hypothetical protein